MGKRGLLLAATFFLIGMFQSVQAAIAGPRLYFEPASGSYDVNEEFVVTVKIDTGGQEVKGTDVVLNFDQSRLTVSNVADGGFFSSFDYELEADSGRLSIYAMEDQPIKTVTGTGNVATITFKASSSGEASVSFLCQAGSDIDTNIWDANANELADCGANGSGVYTITSGESSSESRENNESNSNSTNPTPTPGETAPEAPTPTPSQLPETGVETPFLILGIGGGIMLLLSLVMAL